MPVRVKKIGSKYRLVGPDGEIEKTKDGNARDGGGHSSKGQADAQARAINSSLRYGVKKEVGSANR